MFTGRTGLRAKFYTTVLNPGIQARERLSGSRNNFFHEGLVASRIFSIFEVHHEFRNSLTPTEQEKPRWFSMRTVCQKKILIRHLPTSHGAQIINKINFVL